MSETEVITSPVHSRRGWIIAWFGLPLAFNIYIVAPLAIYDISDIGLSQQTVCVLAKDEAEYAEELPKAQRRYGFFGDIETLGIVGTPEQCIEKIKRNQEKGVTKYTIFFSVVYAVNET